MSQESSREKEISYESTWSNSGTKKSNKRSKRKKHGFSVLELVLEIIGAIIEGL